MNQQKDKYKKPRPTNTDGKMPPQAPEMEELVLGAILLEKEAINQVIDVLMPESFYKDAHGKIYAAILRLFSKAQPIDMATVCNELKSAGELDIAGGPYYIATLTNKLSSAAHCHFHALIVAQKYMQRQLIKVCTQTISEAYDDGADIFDLLDSHEKNYHDILKSVITGKTQTMKSLFKQILDKNDALLKNNGISGVQTDFDLLDKSTGGWQNSDLIIIAARPAMGKTAFAATMARNAAVNHNDPVAIFSLEVSALQLAIRLFASEANLSTSDFIRRGIPEERLNKLHGDCALLVDSNLFIDDTPALTIMELRSKARKLKQDHNIKKIYVDYLQLMRADKDSSKHYSREQEIAAISRGLKQLAKELDIPIIALSQLSRAVETRGGDKRPQLSDLRESGAIEQDADLVIFIHRPEYYNITEDAEGNSMVGIADIIIAKHRNGPVGDVRMGYNAPSTKFYNLTGPTITTPTAMRPSVDFSQPRHLGKNDIEDESQVHI
jgi:replicative DNA helicase